MWFIWVPTGLHGAPAPRSAASLARGTDNRRSPAQMDRGDPTPGNAAYIRRAVGPTYGEEERSAHRQTFYHARVVDVAAVLMAVGMISAISWAIDGRHEVVSGRAEGRDGDGAFPPDDRREGGGLQGGPQPPRLAQDDRPLVVYRRPAAEHPGDARGPVGGDRDRGRGPAFQPDDPDDSEPFSGELLVQPVPGNRAGAGAGDDQRPRSAWSGTTPSTGPAWTRSTPTTHLWGRRRGRGPGPKRAPSPRR